MEPEDGLALEQRRVGSGGPVTVVAHGFGQDLPAARLLAAGLPGTQLLYAARGHGRSALGDRPLTYGVLADDLDAVGQGADRAIGTSLGGTTILHLLARSPHRFRRAVITRPAPLTSGERVTGFFQALRDRDLESVTAYVRHELPPGLGREAEVALRLRVRALLAAPALADVGEQLTACPARPDPAALARTSAQVLFVAQPDDSLHPLAAAKEWADLVPGAELVVVEGSLTERRRRVRELGVAWLSQA